ncbi:MAG: hypothetical protein ACKOYK_00260, partial [Cyanobium sp.]
EGFVPDLVIGHPGWGELLAIKDVFPSVPVLHQLEWMYRLEGGEVIEDGHNGHLVDFFDQEAWLRQLEEVLSKPEEQRILAARARQTVVERYDMLQVCLPQQLALVERVAALSC